MEARRRLLALTHPTMLTPMKAMALLAAVGMISAFDATSALNEMLLTLAVHIRVVSFRTTEPRTQDIQSWNRLTSFWKQWPRFRARPNKGARRATSLFIICLDRQTQEIRTYKIERDKYMAAENAAPGNPSLAQQVLDAMDEQFGLHPGFRPAHAKGLMCSGLFTPSGEVAKLTRAPHASSVVPATVTVRFSNSTGIPTIPDNDPGKSSPRGTRHSFPHLEEHTHTDIVAHSTNGFPVHTGEEFLGLLRAVITAFIKGQPRRWGRSSPPTRNAKRFVETPKPIPTSFLCALRPSSPSRRSSSPTPPAR